MRRRRRDLPLNRVNDHVVTQSVLDRLFHALVRWASPILCFTAEEVWQTRYPSEDGSVHFETWPEVDTGWRDEALGAIEVTMTQALGRLARILSTSAAWSTLNRSPGHSLPTVCVTCGRYPARVWCRPCKMPAPPT